MKGAKNGMGLISELRAGNPELMADPLQKCWRDMMLAGGEQAYKATMELIHVQLTGNLPPFVLDSCALVHATPDRWAWHGCDKVGTLPAAHRGRVPPQSVQPTTRPSMNDTVHSPVPAPCLARPPNRSTALGRPS
jgi:hypothetical protein